MMINRGNLIVVNRVVPIRVKILNVYLAHRTNLDAVDYFDSSLGFGSDSFVFLAVL